MNSMQSRLHELNAKLDSHRHIIVLLILTIMLLNMMLSKQSIGYAFDETAHIASGYYFWKTADFRMNPAHPPLAFLASTFPLLFVDLNFPHEDPSCRDFLLFECGQKFIFESGNDADAMLFLSRLATFAIALLLGYFIYSWSRRLWGTAAGLFSLLLYSFSPTVLAQAGLVLTDLMVTTFIFIAIYYYTLLLDSGSSKHLALASIFTGLALSTKYTAIFLFPIFILFFIIKKLRGKTAHIRFPIKKFAFNFAIITLISLIILCGVYGLQLKTLAQSVPERFIDKGFSVLGRFTPETSLLHDEAYFIVHKVNLPFPTYFGGLAMQFLYSLEPVKWSYLNGEVYQGGKWLYHFEEFVIKNPVAYLLAVLLFGCLYFRNKYRGEMVNDEELILMLSSGLFFAIFIPSKINLGIRHILPMFPFLFVLLGYNLRNSVYRQNAKERSIYVWTVVISMLLLLYYIVSSMLVFPHYMSYFGEVVGGPSEGYKYMVGPNLDNGQDFRGLVRYVKENNIQSLNLSYHGTSDPWYYGIDYTYMPTARFLPWSPYYNINPNPKKDTYVEDCSQRSGIMAVSATNLAGVFLQNKSCFSWLLQHEPKARIGYSIFVYDLPGSNR